MSFILDALKKSELERQRQSVPGLIEMPVAARRRGVPAWVWILVALLCVNVGILLVLLLRGGPPGTALDSKNAGVPAPRAAPGSGAAVRELPAPTIPVPRKADPAPIETPADADAPGAAAPGATAAPDHFSPMDNQAVYAPEIPVPEDGAISSAQGVVTPTPSAHGVPPVHSARHADAGPVLNDDPPDDQEMLPSISELNLTGTQSLPDIHLDVHVYATRSADRFVYINMRKYREGAVLQEGPTLERIRRDGVVLNYNGLRFLVPRQ